jgi:FdhD protein
MMGTPSDLGDFAIGFTVNEGIVESIEEIETLEIVEVPDGTELRIWITPSKSDLLSTRRRRTAGPTGCGICGSESIAAAVRPVATVPEGRVYSTTEIMCAMACVAPLQRLNHRRTVCMPRHFGALIPPSSRCARTFGRHIALDKLAGALARDKVSTSGGMVLLTSRVSVEMVQKTAAIGASLIVAVSVPTGLAVRTADAAGITSCAVARSDGYEIFTHPRRVVTEYIRPTADRSAV